MPIEPVTIVLGTLVSKEIIEKILGPTAEYLGGQAKGLFEKSPPSRSGSSRRTAPEPRSRTSTRRLSVRHGFPLV